MDGMEVNVLRINASWRISDKYETPMLRSVLYTCRLHICDMFDEMLVMASMGLVKVLNKYLL